MQKFYNHRDIAVVSRVTACSSEPWKVVGGKCCVSCYDQGNLQTENKVVKGPV